MTAGAGPALPPEEFLGLALCDFEPLVGTSLAIETEAGVQELVLGTADALPNSMRRGGGFRLEFIGPAQPRLPQAIYAFPIGDSLHEIFIVPIGAGGDQRVRYEAIFL